MCSRLCHLSMCLTISTDSVLWPLLHRMPEKVGSDGNWAKAYKEVNEIFADNIVPYVEDNDIIWVHDYHLLLLPGILRERLKKKTNLKIGFFLHTPFPTEDYFTILPFREEICKSLLLCDVVGFHTNQYAKDFLDSARIVLPGVSRSPRDLHWDGRRVLVHGFPLGIEADDWRASLKTEAAQQELASITEQFKGQKILLGVDRLDYIKGIPQKLRAYDRLLIEHPEWLGKVVLVQLAIPTRADVGTYQKLREDVESLVGRINGKHGMSGRAKINLPHSVLTAGHSNLQTYTYTLSVSVYPARALGRTLCCSRCSSDLLHKGWLEPRELRVHGMPGEEERCAHDV